MVIFDHVPIFAHVHRDLCMRSAFVVRDVISFEFVLSDFTDDAVCNLESLASDAFIDRTQTF
jgi:hypothetical protein